MQYDAIIAKPALFSNSDSRLVHSNILANANLLLENSAMLEWTNYLLETKEFGILKDIDSFDFFVCTTSKSGVALKGDLTEEELDRIENFKTLYHFFYQLDINSQGDVLKKFFPEEA